MNEKILSICIPTYNRAKFLNNLLSQIYEFDSSLKSKIQICVSDNASSDDTQDVILRWGDKLEIYSVLQSNNIGLSRNFQAVARLATCPWTILMGDDDSFIIEGLENLLSILSEEKSETWVLCNIKNPDSTSLLSGYLSGYYSKNRLKIKILQKTLDAYGFMSMYVIPKISVNRFVGLDIDQTYGWPHLALFIMELPRVNIYLVEKCVVLRLADHGEVTQTWLPGDWLDIMMQKTKLCCANIENGKYFNTLLAFREYIRWGYVRQLFASKLATGENKKIFASAFNSINDTNIYHFARWILIAFVLLVVMVPRELIKFSKNVIKTTNKIRPSNQDEIAETDGVKRGL